MAKHLVIVESPAKAKTINKFLGADYEVRASMGHVRDLPATKLGIDIDDDFRPKYLTLPRRASLIKELSVIVKKVETVFLATDLDREGEAIAWHLAEALKIPDKKLRRVIFNEITKRAIAEAFRAPLQLQMSKVLAQQARRILDRIVGYQLSPLLWKKMARGLSAGRVQSVAVKLIVEKERDIESFESEEYWKVVADLVAQQGAFAAELKKYDGKKLVISNEKQALAAVSQLQKEKFLVAEVVSKEKKESPPPPFTTSSLQQQSSIRLRLSTKNTMRIAQQLYEGIEVGAQGPVGLITYMRTDSVMVSQEAIKQCRQYIGEKFASEYLPKTPRKFSNKKAQGAHEAIRPSSVERTPEDIRPFLSNDQYRLYKLIWERFVASQMEAARFAHTTIKIEAGSYLFEAKGKQVVFAGYLSLTGRDEKEDKLLPIVQQGEPLKVTKITPSQHFTQPPPRYTEATLVKALEAKGIGRPSTYSPIISTIQERKYVLLKERKFFATRLGCKVTEKLVQYFPKIIDTDFTSHMETKLDQIEESSIDWVAMLRDFYKLFSENLAHADEHMESLKENPEFSEYTCDECGAKMIYKYTPKGDFLGCSGYPKCKKTVPMDAEGNPVFPEVTKFSCPECKKPMILRQGRQGKFFGCSGFPECKTTLPIGEDGRPVVPQKTDKNCDICNAPMLIKQGKKGGFLACSRYPECKNAKPLDGSRSSFPYSVRAKCEKCGKTMVVRKGRRGVFLGCTGFPSCRNLQKFSAEMIELPAGWDDLKCEKCSSGLKLKGSSRGLFFGCERYPECDYTWSPERDPKPLNDEAAAKEIGKK